MLTRPKDLPAWLI